MDVNGYNLLVGQTKKKKVGILCNIFIRLHFVSKSKKMFKRGIVSVTLIG